MDAELVHQHAAFAHFVHDPRGQADLFETQLPAGASVDDICAHVRRQAEAAVPGQWIIANQWGADMITALNSEASLAKLDAASLGHPVLLRDETMHNRWVNSVALQMCGIANDQQDPPASSFGRDPATGRLTGLLVESAAGIVERVAADHFTEAMGEAAIARAVEIVNSYGVTAFQDAASVLPIMKALTGLDNKGKLTAWGLSGILCLRRLSLDYKTLAENDSELSFCLEPFTR
ncbi:amidohydrolase family protein, partial [Brucella sp. 191011898]|uniref:amidohydrolase family protein n=1 Tax=Brucella sp. 191011898 TaxID=2730447 RepID=UPI001FCE46B0